MKFPTPLVPGRLIRRYKRFLSDIEIATGEQITAHVANPGAMTGLADPGLEVWLSRSDNPKRKLAYSWELVRIGRHLVGVNAGLPNRIVEEALGRGRIPELAAYPDIRREVRYGVNSRVDFLLQGAGLPDCYLEIKNVHLKRGNLAEFPDSVTARGTKHLRELAKMVQAGHRSVMLYLVQRRDCKAFAVAADIDPAYGAALAEARAQGVEILCYTCRIGTDAITLDRPLAIAI
jgi:sugar fermentation stimulation protein A